MYLKRIYVYICLYVRMIVKGQSNKLLILVVIFDCLLQYYIIIIIWSYIVCSLGCSYWS